MTRLWLLTVTAVGAGALSASPAQQPPAEPALLFGGESSLQKEPPAIELEAIPALVAAGGRVDIIGSNFADPKNLGIRVTVIAPGPDTAKHILEATADSSGRFSIGFEKTERGGQYRVEAMSASGSAKGSTTFTVREPAQVFDAVDEIVVELLNAGRDLVQALNERARSLPPSPPKVELIERIELLTSQIEAARKLPLEWKEGADALAKLPQQYPSLRPALKAPFEEFSKWNLAGAGYIRKARAETQRIKATTVTCDTLQALQDGFEFAAFLWTFVLKPTEILTHWAKEWVPPRLVKLAGDTAHAHLPNKGIQIAWNLICCAHHHRKPAWEGIQKTTFEILSVATEKLFQGLCEKFQGPVRGSMFAQFFSKTVEVWWEYKIEFTGQLTIRYPKGQTGGAVTGEFQGHATKFQSWDDAIGIGWPKLTRGAILKRFVTEPSAGSLADALLGEVHAGDAVKSVLTPGFFKVPIEGTLTEEYIELRLREAVVDFKDEKAKVTYFIVSPLTLMLPVWTRFELPYKDARFILGRAMDDAPARFDIVTDRRAKTMTLFREFNRTRESGPTKVTYFLTVKACNPGCGAAH
jgi:hypothetical protein